MRILRILMRPETSEIGVWIAIDIDIICRIKDESFIHDALEISPNSLESIEMGQFRLEGVACTLMDGKGTFWMGVANEIEQHADN
jgi:hypothetical protein